MNYFVKRGEQQYGPYSLAALQQYVTQGNISRQDLARSEAMADWVPVSTIIGNVSVAAPTFGASPAVIATQASKLPPKLHWAVVLALGIVTFGIFVVIWMFVLAGWVRKVRPQSKAMLFLLIYVVSVFAAGFIGAASNGNPAAPLLQVVGIVCYLVGLFMLRSDIEEAFSTFSPAGRGLSGIMTFFFGAIYFQYCLNEYREIAENNAVATTATA